MTAVITATPEPNATPPRVRLDVTTDQSTINLFRINQDGIRVPVRSFDGGPLPVSSGSVLIYDPEAPLGIPVSYTASGSNVTNSATVTVQYAGSPLDVWLVHPGVPSLSQLIRVVTIADTARAANASVRYPLGAKFPVVAHDGQRKAPNYKLTVRTYTLAQKRALDVLLDDLATLLLNVPSTHQWGQDSEYVHAGDLSIARVVEYGPAPFREWSMPCWVVDRPKGGTQADNTYAKSFSLYSTYAARFAASATYKQAFDPS